MPSSKIRFKRLVDLAEGRLSPDEREAVLAQVAASPRAAREVAQLQRLIDLMRSDDSVDAPPHVVARAVRLFRQRAAPEAPGLRQRIRAMLQFDSARRPLAMGVRSGQAAVRQLLFSAEGRDLDLRITPGDAVWTVAGQVLGPCSEGQVELRSPTFTVRATLNELCEFALPPAPAGSYTLNLRLADAEIEIVGLEVGA